MNKRLQALFAPPEFLDENMRIVRILSLILVAAIIVFTVSGMSMLRASEEALRAHFTFYQADYPLVDLVQNFFVFRLVVAVVLGAASVALSLNHLSLRRKQLALVISIQLLIVCMACLQGMLLTVKTSVQMYTMTLFAGMAFTYIPVWLSVTTVSVGMLVLASVASLFAGSNPEYKNILIHLGFISALAVVISAASYNRRCRELAKERELEISNTKLAERNRILERMSVYDALTEITNRRYFDQMMLEAFSHSSSFAVILIDVDNFKKFNDRYGHVAGDVCLHRVAQAIKDVLHRDGDTVSRYGGEEFGVILPGSTCEGALLVAERIRTHIRQLAIPHELNEAGIVTASFGLAVVTSLAGMTQSQLLEAADQCLYQSKAQGRDRVTMVTLASRQA